MLYAEEILYQKQHKTFDGIYVVSLIQDAEDWYYINITIAEDTDAIEKYLIYDKDFESIQDLLFLFEKEKSYRERINGMEKAETLIFLKEKTGIEQGYIVRTKHYLYMK